jgi:hypothetical protein
VIGLHATVLACCLGLAPVNVPDLMPRGGVTYRLGSTAE